MNVRRLAAPIAMGGILVCAAAVALTAIGAFGMPGFELPAEEGAAAGETVGIAAEGSDASTADALAMEVPAPDLATEEGREEYMGREQVIAECMAGKGVTYLPAAPWLNQDAQPRGLSFEQSVMWLNAFYGEARESWSVPGADWKKRGCLGVGEHAVALARAAGAPLSAPVPEPDPNAMTEAEELAAFQDAIRSCMAEQGFGEFDDGTDAWWAAMYGDAGTGAAYRWEDAGCDGYAVHVTGNDNMH
ncbi:hypothetical protein ACFQ58_00445 [Agromyces sp. NPDC056523]|uniref:hypothetical protein n=1 Tax=Agromyces sp. NPDC056523 TaxID=3345850 RepID=UPI00366A7CF9